MIENLDFYQGLSLFLTILPLAMIAGFLAGLLGIGGGLVLVPGLYLIFKSLGYDEAHLMHLALGTSLATIIATGASSARAHYKRGAVNFDLVKQIGAGILFGVIIGTLVASSVTALWLQIFFIVVVFILALLMQLKTETLQLPFNPMRRPVPVFAGGVIGVVGTLMGIGGAALNVPYMTLSRVPIHEAVGSAAFMGLIVAIPAMIGFIIIGQPAFVGEGVHLPPFSLGFVNFLGFVIIAPITVLCAPLGVRTAHYFKPKTLRLIFSFFLVFIGFKMLFEVLGVF